MTQQNSNNTTSVVLVGVGGQGILLASAIVAQAALDSGYDVKTNEIHGMAQRGGSVVAQIRYGEKIYSPLIPKGTATVLASLERVESLRYVDYLAPNGLAVVSDQIIVPTTVSSGAASYPTLDEE
ncbi:MAG: 2-oxoacid:acceptor oxidoreductase family protein, partial [Thermoguttaceae bacterium]|nr:2-oxoacid:acceptor oxidoreductase family protein [Thermoguttaceae bacterium]